MGFISKQVLLNVVKRNMGEYSRSDLLNLQDRLDKECAARVESEQDRQSNVLRARRVFAAAELESQGVTARHVPATPAMYTVSPTNLPPTRQGMSSPANQSQKMDDDEDTESFQEIDAAEAGSSLLWNRQSQK